MNRTFVDVKKVLNYPMIIELVFQPMDQVQLRPPPPALQRIQITSNYGRFFIESPSLAKYSILMLLFFFL